MANVKISLYKERDTNTYIIKLKCHEVFFISPRKIYLGMEIDHWYFLNVSPPRKFYKASWLSLLVETGLSKDNILNHCKCLFSDKQKIKFVFAK